jgi:hypothetical protein
MSKNIANIICDGKADYMLALNILGSGKGLLARRRNAAWNEDYLTELVNKFFIKSF